MSSLRAIDRRLVILGAILIQFALGAVYAWPVFTLALKEAGWSKLDTQIAFSVTLATLAIAMVWAGYYMTTPRWLPRQIAISSGLILGFGYILAGFLGGTSFPVVVLCIGFIGGAGVGIGYMVPITVGMRWFPDHRGMITGIAVAGFGFGAMAWIKLAGEWGLLIEHYGIGTTFIFYGLAFMIIVLTGSTWMVLPPENWSPTKQQATSLHSTLKAKLDNTLYQEYSRTEMLKTVQFSLLFLTFVVSSSAGLMSIGLMKLYPVEVLEASGFSRSEASAIAGTAMAVFFSISNGVGRIIWGTISDRIGPKRALMLMTLSQGTALLLFTSMANSETLLYCEASLVGFNFGGNFALFPSITASIFGPNSIGKNYPLVFLAYGVGGIIGPILGGLLGDLGNFPLAFTICGSSCLAGTGLAYLIKPLPR